jgi:hypothetical protein
MTDSFDSGACYHPLAGFELEILQDRADETVNDYAGFGCVTPCGRPIRSMFFVPARLSAAQSRPKKLRPS